MGRDINFIRQVSMKSGVPIVAGGGYYTQPFYPKEISTMSEEQIVKALDQAGRRGHARRIRRNRLVGRDHRR